MNTDHPGADESSCIKLDDEQRVQKVLVDSVMGLWDIVNNLTRIRPNRREHYRVTIFGSARAEPGSFVYDEVKRVAKALAEMDCDIITGGGPGLMQAANEGASAADASHRSESVGIRVELPFEQENNPFLEQVYEHKSFFTRLHQFVLMSDAFIVVPGGIGTVLELMMIWQLLQVKHLDGCPLILVGSMWNDLLDWAKTHLVTPEQRLANPEDLAIPICVPTGDDAIRLIREHHARSQYGKTPAGT